MNVKNICNKIVACRQLIVMFVVAIALASCKPGIPGKYLQPDEMADILYDYHLAEGINSNNQSGADTIAMRTFRTSILEHHGVTEADFDSSMVYYTRHTKLLEDVYTKLADRFNNESVALGGAAMGEDGDFNSSDTTNIWRQSPSFVLSPYAATNRMTFDLKADTAYHAGDRLILDFNAIFIYQDGTRDASVVLAVTYDNDSIEYVNNSVVSSSHYHLQINNNGRLRIKSVRGYFMLSSDASHPTSSATTLKLLVISNVRLVRMHTKAPVEAPTDADGSATDSVKTVRKDSIQSKPLKPTAEIPAKQQVQDKPTKLEADPKLMPMNGQQLQRKKLTSQ